MKKKFLFLYLIIVFFVSCQKRQDGISEVNEGQLSLYEQENEKAKKLDKPEYHYQDYTVREEKTFPGGEKVRVVSYLNPHECIVTLESEGVETVLLKQDEPKFHYFLMDGRNENEIIAVRKSAECLFYIYLINSTKGVVKTIRTALYADYYDSAVTMRTDGHLQITSNSMSADCVVSVDLDTGISTLEKYEPSYLSWSDMRRDVMNDTVTIDYYSADNKYFSMDTENYKFRYDFLGNEMSDDIDVSEESVMPCIKLNEKKYILLCDEYFCFLLDENNKLIFHGNSFHAMSENRYKAELSYSTPADLISEPELSGLDALSNIDGVQSWGCHINKDEKEPDIQIKSKTNISALLLFSGLVSFDDPSLYQKYSRVKSIEITDEKTKESYSVLLADTPEPQYISVFPGDAFSIKILETYPGEESESVCINAIIGIDEKYGYFI